MKAWREREGVDCYRAYDADLPEYAAAIDVYTGRRFARSTGCTCRNTRRRRKSRKRRRASALNELLAAARDVFALPKERIALKTRSIGKGGSKYGRFDRRGEFSSCAKAMRACA